MELALATEVVSNIDILIPHYADAEGLSRSLASLADQTWSGRMRALVQDDGSSVQQATAAVAACKRHAVAGRLEIEFEANTQNRGRPETRNALLARARAPYLGWLDAGDIWYPEKLARQFATLRHLEGAGHDVSCLWVSCGYDWDQAGRVHARTQNVGGDQLKSLLLGDDLRAYLWTLIGRSEAFGLAGRFDPRLPRLQDLDYFLTFVRAGGRIVVPEDEEPLCRYFKSHAGRDAAEVAKSYALIMQKSVPVLHRYDRKFRARLKFKAHMLPADFARANGDWSGALLHRARAVIAAPDHVCRIFAYKIKRAVIAALKRTRRASGAGRVRS